MTDQQSNIIVVTIGGTGGGTFPLQSPAIIGMRSGSVVDALILNLKKYGGNGGSATDMIQPTGPNYFNYFSAGSKSRNGHPVVGFLSFGTTDGALVKAGSAQPSRTIDNCRVLSVGGKSGKVLDQIEVQLVTNYSASNNVVKTAPAVFGLIPPGSTYSDYQTQSAKNAQTYTYTSTFMTSVKVNASAAGEYYAQWSASTELTTTYSSMESIVQESDTYIESQKKIDIPVPVGSSAFLIGSVTIWADSSGTNWIQPDTSLSLNWVVLQESQYDRLIGSYCFAAGVPIQTGLSTTTVNQFQVLA